MLGVVKVMLVVPTEYPAVHGATLAGFCWPRCVESSMQISPPSPMHPPALEVHVTNVELGPEPRRITLLQFEIVIWLPRLNDPGPSRTYLLAPQAAAMAVLIVVTLAPAEMVEPLCV